MSSSTPPHPASAPSTGWSRRHDHDAPGHHRVLDLGRLVLGLTVVAIGVLFLLDSAGTLDADRVIDRWWPVLIAAAGVLTLLERPPAVLRGLLLTAIGVILLLFTTDAIEGNAWDYVWPAAVIAVGLAIVVRWRGPSVLQGARDQDVVRATAVFGGPKLISTSQRFRGAWLTAIFGGVTLDLRDAVPAPDGASINATAAFGGIDVLVPRGWHVSSRVTPIFGGFDDKTDHSVAPAPDAPTLHLDAVCVFGGVSLKHAK